jgi:hypothetical protein
MLLKIKLLTIFLLFFSLKNFGQYTVIEENFDDNSNFWTEINSDSVSAKIEGGKYVIETKKTHSSLYFWTSNLGIDYSKDFRLEIDVEELDFTGFKGETFARNLAVILGEDEFSSKNKLKIDFNQVPNFGNKSVLYSSTQKNNKIVFNKVGNTINLFYNSASFGMKKIDASFNDFGTKIGFKLSDIIHSKTKLVIDKITLTIPQTGQWIDENTIFWKNPKKNISTARKKNITLEFDYLDKSKIEKTMISYRDTTFYLNVTDDLNKINLKLAKGINTVRIVVFDKFGNGKTEEKLIKYERGKENIRKTKVYLFANETFDEWEKLNTPIKDADTLAQLFKFYFYIDYQVIKNKNKTDFLRILDSIKVNEKQSCIFYFAGHGIADSLQNAYWVTKDSKLSKSDFSSYVSWQEIGTIIEKKNQNQKLLIADACFSGLINEIKWEMNYDCPYMNQLFISSGKDLVSDGLANENSPFTLFLFDLLKNASTSKVIGSEQIGTPFFYSELINYGSFGNSCSDFQFIIK